MARFYSRRPIRSRRLPALLLALALVGCGGAPRKAAETPDAKVRAEVELAQDQEQLRAYDRAREHYERAIALAAEDPEALAYAHREFASALIFWGEYLEAINELKRSLQADPRQIQAWHDLGVLQAQDPEQHEVALAALERALALDTSEPRTRVAIAALLMRMGRFREAQAHYQVLLTLDIPPSMASAARRALSILQEQSASPGNDPAKPVPGGP